jgi:signal transduction histidine kinase
MKGEQLQSIAVQLAGTIRLARANGRARLGRWTEDLGARPQWPAVRSWVTAPLIVRGETRGTLTLFQDLPPEAEEPSRTLTEDFARRASMVLENSALLRRAAEATRARDEMMAVLAHDLSSVLFSFRLHAQRGLVRGGEQAQRALGVVARGSQWLLGLVKTVVDVAGMEGEKIHVQPQPGNLAQVLESACALQQMDADDRHLVVERAWPAELLLDFDLERMLQVLFNLVNNAVKFAPVGGRVVVGAEHDGRQVRVWVRDSGMGLQPEEVERVFERGWQANPKAGGKGLGLYISQRIVEAHGGTVWVESTPGHGATFHVSLPVGSGARASPQDETSVAP